MHRYMMKFTNESADCNLQRNQVKIDTLVKVTIITTRFCTLNRMK